MLSGAPGFAYELRKSGQCLADALRQRVAVLRRDPMTLVDGREVGVEVAGRVAEAGNGLTGQLHHPAYAQWPCVRAVKRVIVLGVSAGGSPVGGLNARPLRPTPARSAASMTL